MNNVKRGQIYYADLAPIIGSEQDGIRPVLILQNDIGNKYANTTIIAPITSAKPNTYFPTHVRIKAKGLMKDSAVLLEQIRTIDKQRLTCFVDTIGKTAMGKVDNAIITSLGIKTMEVLL